MAKFWKFLTNNAVLATVVIFSFGPSVGDGYVERCRTFGDENSHKFSISSELHSKPLQLKFKERHDSDETEPSKVCLWHVEFIEIVVLTIQKVPEQKPGVQVWFSHSNESGSFLGNYSVNSSIYLVANIGDTGFISASIANTSTLLDSDYLLVSAVSNESCGSNESTRSFNYHGKCYLVIPAGASHSSNLQLSSLCQSAPKQFRNASGLKEFVNYAVQHTHSLKRKPLRLPYLRVSAGTLVYQNCSIVASKKLCTFKAVSDQFDLNNFMSRNSTDRELAFLAMAWPNTKTDKVLELIPIRSDEAKHVPALVEVQFNSTIGRKTCHIKIMSPDDQAEPKNSKKTKIIAAIVSIAITVTAAVSIVFLLRRRGTCCPVSSSGNGYHQAASGEGHNVGAAPNGRTVAQIC